MVNDKLFGKNYKMVFYDFGDYFTLFLYFGMRGIGKWSF
jgi:hypothetical protein